MNGAFLLIMIGYARKLVVIFFIIFGAIKNFLCLLKTLNGNEN